MPWNLKGQADRNGAFSVLLFLLMGREIQHKNDNSVFSKVYYRFYCLFKGYDGTMVEVSSAGGSTVFGPSSEEERQMAHEELFSRHVNKIKAINLFMT